MANLVRCSICNAEYSYCPNCANTRAWKFYTDTHECYQVFMIIKQYGMDHNKEKAREMLENIGITSNSDLSKYKPNIAIKIKDILASKKIVDLTDDFEKATFKRSRRSRLNTND